jgi:hypothetical protein
MRTLPTDIPPFAIAAKDRKSKKTLYIKSSYS